MRQHVNTWPLFFLVPIFTSLVELLVVGFHLLNCCIFELSGHPLLSRWLENDKSIVLLDCHLKLGRWGLNLGLLNRGHHRSKKREANQSKSICPTHVVDLVGKPLHQLLWAPIQDHRSAKHTSTLRTLLAQRSLKERRARDEGVLSIILLNISWCVFSLYSKNCLASKNISAKTLMNWCPQVQPKLANNHSSEDRPSSTFGHSRGQMLKESCGWCHTPRPPWIRAQLGSLNIKHRIGWIAFFMPQPQPSKKKQTIANKTPVAFPAPMWMHAPNAVWTWLPGSAQRWTRFATPIPIF